MPKTTQSSPTGRLSGVMMVKSTGRVWTGAGAGSAGRTGAAFSSTGSRVACCAFEHPETANASRVKTTLNQRRLAPRELFEVMTPEGFIQPVQLTASARLGGLVFIEGALEVCESLLPACRRVQRSLRVPHLLVQRRVGGIQSDLYGF